MFSETINKIKGISLAQRRFMVVGAVFAVWVILSVEFLRRVSHSGWSQVPAVQWIGAFAVSFEVLPGLIAILLMFTPRAMTRVGTILQGVTVVSLIVGPLFGVNFMWMAIAFPLLFAGGLIVLGLAERSRKKPTSEVYESGETEMHESAPVKEKVTSAQWTLVALIVAFTGGGLLYRLLLRIHLQHSAAMFIGIPAVLAILLALTPRAKSVTGGILKGITLALLIIAPLLGEGYVCILVASPLFYIVGIVVGGIVDWQNRRRTATLSCLALVLLPMSLEGVVPILTFHRFQSVEARKVVAAPADAVERQLALSPLTTARLPVPLRIGFPRPLAASGDGFDIGALRTIHFSGAEGDPPGDLTMRITERRPGYVRFEEVSDHSKLSQWIAWDSSEVHWNRLDATHTLVTWRVNFKRQLDPAWYFAPLEHAAVYQAANYLIQANATPPGIEQ